MKHRLHLFLSFLLFVPLFGQETIRKEIPRTNEKELRVSLELSFGTVILTRGKKDLLFSAEYPKNEKESNDLKIEYQVENNRGELTVRSKDKSRFWKGWKDDDKGREQKWVLELTEDIPIHLDVELGAGKGDLDVTGLRLKKLDISLGASSLDLVCSEPNKERIEKVVISSGVSRFQASGVSNLNFERFSFSGGVGSYRLDFDGRLQQNCIAKIEVGLGSIVINLPEELPARILYDDNFLSTIDLDPIFSRVKKGEFESPTYSSSQKRLTIQVESGLGSVKVRSK